VQDGRIVLDKGKSDKELTNFIFVPKYMVASKEEGYIVCECITDTGEMYEMMFQTDDFASLRKFKNKLNKNHIALCYFGTEGDLEYLKEYVYGLEWKHRKGVKSLGIYNHGSPEPRLVFVDTEKAVAHGDEEVDTIIQIDKHKIIESTILNAPFITKEQLQALGKHMLTYNIKKRTVPILAWIAACFVKPHLKNLDIKFPIMLLVGERGGGKSTVSERIILKVHGRKKGIAADQTKLFMLLKESNSSNVIPQVIEEFKPAKLAAEIYKNLCNHMRNTYDGTAGYRGKSDLSHNAYELLAPVLVCGEASHDESAIRERAIELLFSKKDLKATEHRESYKWVMANGNVFSAFGRSLLDTALGTTLEEVNKWYAQGMEHFTADMPDRILNNLCVMYTGLCLVNKLCHAHGMSFTEVFGIDNVACVEHLHEAVKKYLLDDSSYNKGVVEHALEVMSRMKLKEKVDYAFEHEGKYLCLHVEGVYDRFTKYHNDYKIAGEVLSDTQFRQQLGEMDYCIESSRQKKLGGKNRRVYVIDFHELKKVCNVDGFEPPDNIPE